MPTRQFGAARQQSFRSLDVRRDHELFAARYLRLCGLEERTAIELTLKPDDAEGLDHGFLVSEQFVFVI
jgi:hypothetical protein